MDSRTAGIVYRNVLEVDKPLEITPEEIRDRVARGIAGAENTEELRNEWAENFKWLMDDWKFIPGGRILAAAGTTQQLTYYNCYVIPSPEDSRAGIFKTAQLMAEIMSRGGGVGVNLSTLRPRRAYVAGVNGRSSGAVSWGGMLSYITGLIEQGGCFAPDVHIATEQGAIPAQELYERMENGEEFDANTHIGQRKIVSHFSNGIKQVFSVRTERGLEISVTAEHRIAVDNNGEIETVSLKDLSVGSEILALLPDELNNHGMVLYTDKISSIEPVGKMNVYDFEVEGVHLISGNGVYTSNSRRGALMLILEDWHPDILEFITSKTTAGKITNANISVAISDEFMQAVADDSEWVLSFPDTSHPEYKNYNTVWENDYNQWRNNELPIVEYKRLPARELWQQITESAWASAEPGIWFIDRANHESNTRYHNNLIATNPCFTGDTRIYTDEGIITAGELYDSQSRFNAVIDSRFGFEETILPSTPVFKTGDKSVCKIITKEGYSVRVTHEHKIMTPSGWAEASSLVCGDKIHILNHAGGFGQYGSKEKGRVLGWLVGDGSLSNGRAILWFYHEKRNLSADFAGWVNDILPPSSRGASFNEDDDRNRDNVSSAILYKVADSYGMVDNKHQVPNAIFQGTAEMQRGFLQGLFTADGTVSTSENKKSHSVRLTSIDISLLQQVQQLLLNFGIASRIYENRKEAGCKNMPDGNGGLKKYYCQAYHDLVISKTNISIFHKQIGFLLVEKQKKLIDVLDSYNRGPYTETYTATVKEIIEDGYESVYDITVDKAHSLIANGIVISNCGEIALSEFGVCNLGAINLSQFYNKKTNNIDEEALEKAISYAVRFLDNVIDTTPYFLEKNRIVQMNERRIGLGTMGLAELLIKMKIRYGSEESIAFIEGLYDIIRNTAYLTSAELAWEKGAYHAFELDLHQHSGFMKRLLHTLRNRPECDATGKTIYTNAVHFLNTYEEYGMRNCALLTQAPTGTTGTMVDTSTGIEPFFAFEYHRQGHLGKWLVEVPIAKQWREANPGEDLPEYFVTAMDLLPEEHIIVQATVQKFIDNAISKTCNVPTDYTVEQVAELYELMYDLGCKGGTVYRDQSRDEQVLTLKDDCMTGTCEL